MPERIETPVKPTLRQLRKDSCMRITEIAYKIGACEASIYMWERAQAEPTLGLAMKLAALYGKHVDEIDWKLKQ